VQRVEWMLVAVLLIMFVIEDDLEAREKKLSSLGDCMLTLFLLEGS